MKQKDLVYLLAAVAIFLVAGYFAYTKLIPQNANKKKTVTVQVVGKFEATLNDDARKQLEDDSVAHDFSLPITFDGLGHKQLFGP